MKVFVELDPVQLPTRFACSSSTTMPASTFAASAPLGSVAFFATAVFADSFAALMLAVSFATVWSCAANCLSSPGGMGSGNSSHLLTLECSSVLELLKMPASA